MVKQSRITSVEFLIIYGVLLGMCLGCTSSVATLTLWNHFGRPDRIVRQGWEGIHVVVMMGAGGGVGIFYGVLLYFIKNRPRTYTMWILTFLLTIVEASVVYFVGEYIEFGLMPGFSICLEHPIIFLLSLATVALFGRLSSDKTVGKEMPSED
ncbi:MAG: hypothetical protein ACYSU4_15155 [Planctomycetota bacterium]|jgi:hypothetical protein